MMALAGRSMAGRQFVSYDRVPVMSYRRGRGTCVATTTEVLCGA